MHNCIKCDTKIIPTARQLRKSDFICLPCNRVRQREWRNKRKALGNPVISTKMSADYWREYESRPLAAHKKKIRGLTKGAIARGEINRSPCDKCGDENSEVHHLSYSTPFNVVWLCKTHHHEEHQKAKGE